MRQVAVLVACVVGCHHDSPAPEMPSNQAPPPPPAARVADAAAIDTGVPACDEVAVLYERYFQCDKLVAAGSAAVQAARGGFEAIKQGWAHLKGASQASKDEAAMGCRQMSEALRQGAAAMGCTL